MTRLTTATVLLLAVGTASRADETFPSELVSFQPHEGNPVFRAEGPGHWDVKIRERGWILKEGDIYHLWYTGYNGERSGLKMLGYATSPDGYHWTRASTEPIYREGWVEDMMVLKDGDTYFMAAEGEGDVAQLLTSTDRIHWTRVGPFDVRLTTGKPIPAGPYGTPTLWKEDDAWYLFYERGDQGVWLASSKDRAVWTNVSDRPVLGRGPQAYDRFAVALNQIIRYKDRYYAYYHAADTPEWKRWSTNVASSADLVTWTKYPGNPIVSDNKSSGILVNDGKQYRLYTMHDQIDVFLPKADNGATESKSSPK